MTHKEAFKREYNKSKVNAVFIAACFVFFYGTLITIVCISLWVSPAIGLAMVFVVSMVKILIFYVDNNLA